MASFPSTCYQTDLFAKLILEMEDNDRFNFSDLGKKLRKKEKKDESKGKLRERRPTSTSFSGSMENLHALALLEEGNEAHPAARSQSPAFRNNPSTTNIKSSDRAKYSKKYSAFIRDNCSIILKVFKKAKQENWGWLFEVLIESFILHVPRPFLVTIQTTSLLA